MQFHERATIEGQVLVLSIIKQIESFVLRRL